jgi:hypothetical protein
MRSPAIASILSPVCFRLFTPRPLFVLVLPDMLRTAGFLCLGQHRQRNRYGSGRSITYHFELERYILASAFFVFAPSIVLPLRDADHGFDLGQTDSMSWPAFYGLLPLFTVLTLIWISVFQWI